MSSISWTSTSSGNWNTAGDWSGGAVPTAADSVSIDVASVTVTISTGTLAAESLSTTLSTLDVIGGTLTVSGGETIGGAYEQSGGTLVSDALATFNDGLAFSGGLLDDLSSLSSSSTDTISAGTITVAGLASIGGTYEQSGGAFIVSAGGSFTSGLALTGGVLQDAGSFSSFISQTQSAGTITAGGDALVNGAYDQTGGAFIIHGPSSSFSGGLVLGGGLLEDFGNFLSFGTYAQSAGTLALAGAGGSFNNNLLETGGLIDLLSGTLGLAGAVTTLDGTVTGNGTLVVEGQAEGLNGTTTIAQSTVLSVAKLSVINGDLALNDTGTPYSYAYNGYFNATGGTISLGGNTLQLKGRAELGDQISGAGNVIAASGAQLDNLTLNNAAVLTIDNTATIVPFQDGPGAVTLENNATITIASSGSLLISGNDTITDLNYNSTLLDNGVLSRVSGVGTAEILSSFTEAATATVAIAAGALDFSGVSNSFSGTVSGAGTLSLGAFNTGQPQSFSFGSGVALNVANLALGGITTNDQLTISNSLTYAGSWSQGGGLFTMIGSAPVLDLTGSVILDGGVIKTNTGTINTTGLVSLGNDQFFNQGVDIEGFTTLTINDVARQSASIGFGTQSGSKPTAVISAGGSWLIEDGASITGPYGTVINNGTLAKLTGSGISNIDGTLNNYGVFTIAASEMLLDGSGTLAGTISGGGQLDLEGNGIYTLSSAVTVSATQTASALALDVAHVLIGNTPFGADASVVSLGENLTYAGAWGQNGGNVQLNGDTLTLSGTAALDGGTLTGPGTLNATGALTIGNSLISTYTIGSQATLNIEKGATSEQSINLTVSALGDLNIAAGATYTIDDAATYSGNGTISVAGALNSTAGGITTINPSVVVTGKITATEGTLTFLGSVTGSGSILGHAGTQLDLDGAVSAATTINLAAGNAGLLIGDAPAFAAVIGSFTTGDLIEFQQLSSGVINDSLSSNGETLTISDSSGHTFTLDFNTAQSLTGTHALFVADGSNGLIGVYHS
jgi:hypothetical protein